MANKHKQILAGNYIAELIRFLGSHPKGYSQEDMLYIIRTWAKIASNIEAGGNPKTHGAAYWGFMKKNILNDYNVSPDMPMPRQSPDDDTSVKPSQAFRTALNDLINQIYGGNDIRLGYAFNNTEGAFLVLLMGYRIKLAQADPDAGQAFRRSLSQLRHSHAP